MFVPNKPNVSPVPHKESVNHPLFKNHFPKYGILYFDDFGDFDNFEMILIILTILKTLKTSTTLTLW